VQTNLNQTDVSREQQDDNPISPSFRFDFDYALCDINGFICASMPAIYCQYWVT